MKIRWLLAICLSLNTISINAESLEKLRAEAQRYLLEQIKTMASNEAFCGKGTLFNTTIRSSDGKSCESKLGASVAMMVCDYRFWTSLKPEPRCKEKAKKAGIVDAKEAKNYLTLQLSDEEFQPESLCNLITSILPDKNKVCGDIIKLYKNAIDSQLWSNDEAIRVERARKLEEAGKKAEAARVERERAARVESERAARVESERAARVESERAARVESERAARVERERAARVESERAARVESERAARVESERAARVESERAARVESERAARVERERAARVERERIAYEKAVENERQQELERVEREMAFQKAREARIIAGAAGGLRLKAESQFGLNIKNLSDGHEQTNQILKTQIANEMPFVITSTLTFSDGRIFYFSNILKGGKYDLAIMYAKEDKTGLFVPRLLYKSQSDGGWRVSPEVTTQGFSKGQGIHYTQETKPVEEIVIHLGQMEDPGRNDMLKQISNFSKEVYKKVYDEMTKNFFWAVCTKNKDVCSYNHEVEAYESESLKPFRACKPAECFKRNSSENPDLWRENAIYFYKLFENLQYPPGFLPDLSKQLREYEFTHTLLGSTKVEVFGAKLDGKDIEWHFARDKHGRVWIDRIIFSDRRVNSYGLPSLAIDSGLLTNKPLEYDIQSGLLWEKDKNAEVPMEDRVMPFLTRGKEKTDYYDITPLLDKLKPITEYRAVRKIIRSP